jgi:hypothetical protein
MPVQFPNTPGIELAGVIEEIGPGVTGFQKGQAVYANGGGTNAEYAVVPAGSLAPMPRNLAFDEAAGVPVGALTAWRALFDAADLQPGQRVLVQGAAGGVGSYGVQLARGKGRTSPARLRPITMTLFAHLGWKRSLTTRRRLSRPSYTIWMWCWTQWAAMSRLVRCRSCARAAST